MSDERPETNEVPEPEIIAPEPEANEATEEEPIIIEEEPAALEEEAAPVEAPLAAAAPAVRNRTNRFRRPRRKVCLFCVEKAETIDYKQIWQPKYARLLLTERGRIVPRRTRGLCAKHQRMAARAIKRARHMALLPFVVK